MTFWSDAAILGAAGIPSVLFGPGGAGLHSPGEYVRVEDVLRCRDALVRAGAGVPALNKTKPGLVFVLQALPKTEPGLERAIASRRRLLRDAALAEERQPDDVARRLRCFDPRRHTLHIPPWRFVPARGALQRNPPLFEMQQRVVAVKAAQELPHLPGRPADQRRSVAVLVRWFVAARIRSALPSSPFVRRGARVTGRKRLLLSHSAARQPSGFQEQCQRMVEVSTAELARVRSVIRTRPLAVCVRSSVTQRG